MANKKTAKKATTGFQANIQKIKKAATTINAELTQTVDVLVKDAKANTNEVTSTFGKIQLKDSFQTIGKTVKTVNAQVIETATEIMEDTYATSKKWSEDMMEATKKNIENIDVTPSINQIKSTVKTANEVTLKTADEVVGEAVKSAEKWQGITQKAINGGLKLADKQQDIVFDSLETVKDQLKGSATRLRKILNWN